MMQSWLESLAAKHGAKPEELVTDPNKRSETTDSGVGVLQDMQQKLFHAFATSKPAGIGVGLSISPNIIESHNGGLWFEPNPSGGSIFHVSLPRSFPVLR